MKPKEYRKKYPWTEGAGTFDFGVTGSIQEFKEDIRKDFIAMLDANLHTMSLKRFDFLLFEELKSKYTSIFSSTTLYSVQCRSEIQQLWKEIISDLGLLREEYCKEEMDAAQARFEERRKREEQERVRNEQRRRDQKEQLDELFRRMFGTNAFDFFSMFAPVSNVPVKSFQYFSIDSSSVNRGTIEIVNTKYKQFALKLHPDKGGTDEAFRTLQEHRKRCLEYLNRLTS